MFKWNDINRFGLNIKLRSYRIKKYTKTNSLY